MSFEPFLRWAGGKTWLVPYLERIMGSVQVRHYHEPFLGGGAIFFNTEHGLRSYLSDSNEELINTYINVRDNPEALIQIIQDYENTTEFYYLVRNQISNNCLERAARFIYLNQTSYNGLYRVNKKGQYNVPFGNRESWKFDAEKIRTASKKLQNANIKCCDFEGNKYIIKYHDLVFIDPPYTVSKHENGFIKYNQHLFTLEDQHRLSRFIDFIKRKDAYYILTNASHQAIATIFEKGDRRLDLQRASLIGGRQAKRQHVTEYVFTNIPEE